MEVKHVVFVIVVCALSMTTARPRCARRDPCQSKQKSVYFSNLAAPFPTLIESIDYIPCKTCCKRDCNDQLILPPLSVELPAGLGYFPAAAPLVSKYFAPSLDFLTTGAYIPITSACDSLVLAAPVNPEYAPLVKPIIL